MSINSIRFRTYYTYNLHLYYWIFYLIQILFVGKPNAKLVICVICTLLRKKPETICDIELSGHNKCIGAESRNPNETPSGYSLLLCFWCSIYLALRDVQYLNVCELYVGYVCVRVYDCSTSIFNTKTHSPNIYAHPHMMMHTSILHHSQTILLKFERNLRTLSFIIRI